MSDTKPNYSGLRALYINATLTKSPEKSHTQLLIDASAAIMEKQGVQVTKIRAVDHAIAPGVYPDMREHGWEKDEWPELYRRVEEADILVLAGPIWLGDNSSEMKKVIERLDAHSGDTKSDGRYVHYGKVGGCLITGNEDGVKHCAMNVLYSLQHIGFTVPPQADAGWIGEIGPGPSYGDKTEDGERVGLDSDFTNRNVTFMTWNLMHLASILQDNPIPAYGNLPNEWKAGTRFDFENPEYR